MINFGDVGLPPLLLAADWQPDLLYLMPLLVLCGFAAWRNRPPETH